MRLLHCIDFRRDRVLVHFKHLANFASVDAIPRELTLRENRARLDNLIEPYIDQHFSLFEVLFFVTILTSTDL